MVAQSMIWRRITTWAGVIQSVSIIFARPGSVMYNVPNSVPIIKRGSLERVTVMFLSELLKLIRSLGVSGVRTISYTIQRDSRIFACDYLRLLTEPEQA